MSSTADTLSRPQLTASRVSLRGIPAETWALAGLIAIAAAIRILTIDNQSLWADEALTAYEAHLPFGAMLHTVAHVETTPPLYFVVVWCWAHLFGTGEVALRSVSTIAGIALVPIAYLAGRELVSRRAGLLAAAFVTVNPFLIWYSQEARSYMLLAALSGASFAWFVRARRDPSARNLAWWAACSALAVMTHFFAGFLVAAEALWLLWSARTRRAWIAVAFVAAVQAAMLPLAAADTSHGANWIARIPRSHRVATTISEWAVSLLTRRVTMGWSFAGGALLLIVVGALLWLGGDAQLRRRALLAGSAAAFVFVVPLLLGYFGEDYFLSRNEIPAFVPLAVLVAAACVAPRARLAGSLLALALLGIFSFGAVYVQTHPFLERPDWRAVAQALGQARVPRAVLAADGTTADPLKIYLPDVSWVQPRRRPELVEEIDVVGAIKKIALAQRPAAVASVAVPTPYGRPVPRSVAPPGSVLLERIRVHNWVIARFRMRTARRLTIDQLSQIAPEFFRHTPAALLIFLQRPNLTKTSG